MERYIIQDGITYRIEDDVLKGWTGQSPFQKPTLNGTFDAIIEGITQQEIDAKVEEDLERIVSDALEVQEIDGIVAIKKLRAYIKRRLDRGDITINQFKGIKVGLRPVVVELKLGEWENASDYFNPVNVEIYITPPSNQTLLDIYNLIKNKIENYNA